MTIKEFRKASAAYDVCELVEGQLVPELPSDMLQGRAASNLSGLLFKYVKRVGGGRVLGNKCGLVTDPVGPTVRGVDVLYISHDRFSPKIMRDEFLRKPPEFIAEIKGKNRTWSGLLKRVEEYHKFGVDLVWLVDPKLRAVHTFPNGGKCVIKFEHEMIAGGKVLPKFKCKIARFFED